MQISLWQYVLAYFFLELKVLAGTKADRQKLGLELREKPRHLQMESVGKINGAYPHGISEQGYNKNLKASRKVKKQISSKK